MRLVEGEGPEVQGARISSITVLRRSSVRPDLSQHLQFDFQIGAGEIVPMPGCGSVNIFNVHHNPVVGILMSL